MAKKQFTVYRLHFTSPLHIGDAREDYGISLKTLSSDTLYAALTATLAKMGESLSDDGDLGCVISSLFPYRKDAQATTPTYYFPKPLGVRYPKDLKPEDFKKAKKMQWLDLPQFEKALYGQPIEVCDNPDFIKSEVSERVLVSRDYSENSKPFYMDRVCFEGDSGLFFIAEGDTTMIDKALPLLALEGIGTDRNVGNGFFEYDRDILSVSLPHDAEYGLSLSTFIPESKEQLTTLLSNHSSYELQRRGGWITTAPYNSIRKNVIYAFAAGSVFYGIQSGAGRIVDLAPQGLVKHPIWRCGKALVLPIKMA